MQSFLVYLVIVINIVAALPTDDRNPIDQLYDNLLQREDIGQIGFPKHEVERKAQRSPSLRLRFGRSDPAFLRFGAPSLEKRYYNWFGDVNQKPIRSPSLRLRFGRRSDPSVAVHGSRYDPDADHPWSANDIPALSDVNSQSVRMLLEALRQIEEENNNQYFDKENNNNNEDTGFYDTTNNMDEQDQQRQQFDRETRKPRNSQLRLRWGRSTGYLPAESDMNNNQEKLMTSMDNSLPEIEDNKNISAPEESSSSTSKPKLAASSSSNKAPLEAKATGKGNKY